MISALFRASTVRFVPILLMAIAQARAEAPSRFLPPYRLGPVSIGGRVLLDGGWRNRSPSEELEWDDELRSVRVIHRLDTRSLRGRFQFELSEGRVEIPVLFLRWRGDGPGTTRIEITGGLARPPNAIESRTRIPTSTFLERARFTQAFSFSRQIGAALRIAGDRTTAGIGVFRGALGDEGNLDNWTTAAQAGRFYGEEGDVSLYLGASARYRRTTGGQSPLRYRARSASRGTERRVDTGRFARSDAFAGIEGRWRWRRIALTGEWGLLRPLDVVPGVSDSPWFHGGYAGMDYQILGAPADLRSLGADRRPAAIARPLSAGGLGQVRASVRYDLIDLSAGSVRGGRQGLFQTALVWRPETPLKFTAEYARASVSDGATGPVEHAVTLRAQILF